MIAERMAGLVIGILMTSGVVLAGAPAMAADFAPAKVTVTDRVTSGVIVRQGPGRTAARLGMLKVGQTARATEEVDGWYRVELEDGTIGFVFADLIEVLEAEQVALAIPATAPPGGVTDPTQARDFLARFTERGATILQEPGLSADEEMDRLRELLIAGFDIPAIGNFVLGRHATRLEPVDKARYDAVYFDFVLSRYFERLANLGDWRFALMDVRDYGEDDQLVDSEILRADGEPLKVQWRVSNQAGDYMIVDVLFEGVSLAVTQRSEFSSILRREGVDALIARMQEKTE